MKQISILGSTGSIGTQTLDVVRANKDMKVVALAAGNNLDLLEKQTREFRPAYISCRSEEGAADLRQRLADLPVKIGYGMDGLISAAVIPEAETVVGAVVGMMGIRPSLAAIEAGKDLALANKETLVTAGHIIMQRAKECGVRILPVDSEHSAVFQCMNGEPKDGIDRLLLTASGGPFRGKTRAELENITVEQALKHPNWSMGKKVTIDSSTMANKGLEVMEAHWLFDVDYEKIDVLIQPKSIVHSMIQTKDGAVMAQLGTPDMKLPIQYALCYPERRYLAGERLDLAKLASIQFEAPDFETFPALRLAFEAGKTGGTAPTVFNAANEEAVALFLDRKIRYLEIADLIQYCLERIPVKENPTLDEIFSVQAHVSELVQGYLKEG